MTIDDDEQLLNSLGAMFASELVHRPSDDERQAFLQVVAAQPRAEQDDAESVVVPFERPNRRWGRRVAVGGASVVVALSGLTAVAAAANDGVLPTPARVVARAVGLPVDSVELAKAKDALRRLRGADDAELPKAIERVEQSLTSLSGGERAEVEDTATRQLEDARSRRGRGSGSGGGSGDDGTSGGSSATSVGGQAPSGSTSPTSDDRGRGGSDGGSPNSSTDDGSRGGPSSSAVDGSGSDRSGSGSGGGDGGPRGGSSGSDDSVAATSPTVTAPASDDGGHGGGSPATTEAPHSTTATTTSPGGTTDDRGGGGGGSGGGSGSGGKKP